MVSILYPSFAAMATKLACNGTGLGKGPPRHSWYFNSNDSIEGSLFFGFKLPVRAALAVGIPNKAVQKPKIILDLRKLRRLLGILKYF
jgi:hypothetical protein